MGIELSCPAEIEDRGALEALLEAYYRGVLPKRVAVGGPEMEVAEMMDGVWDDLADYLPPKGCIVLAHDAGDLVGCGFLRSIGGRRGEMKRMFVRPEAQGHGLGWRLIEARIEAARAMGLTQLYADTVRGNDAMLRLYARFGFAETERYEGNANGAKGEPFLVYRVLDL
jgi:GNAT superfamily N-acetyltransferase